MLHILSRDVRGRTNSTYVRLHITSIYIPLFGEGGCVRLSPAGSSVTFIGPTGVANRAKRNMFLCSLHINIKQSCQAQCSTAGYVWTA